MFIALPVLIVAALVTGVVAAGRRSGEPPARSLTAAATVLAGAAVWMALTWMLAARGVFLDFDRRPPPFAFLVAGIVGLAVALARGPVGRRLATLPLWTLVAVQAFRLPLEMAMHDLADRGVMPIQMSYAGLNFDIATGATAIVVAALVATGRAGSRLVRWWNWLGLALLANIVTIAVASTPAFAAFGPARLNTFVFHPPYVWLPAVLVLAALAGHLVILRALATPAAPAGP